MDPTRTSAAQAELILEFVEIAFGHTIDTAIHFLRASNWDLQDAVNLFLNHRANQPMTYQYPLQQYPQLEGKVPTPLPSSVETLYAGPSMDSQHEGQVDCEYFTTLFRVKTYASSKFLVQREEPKEDCKGNLVCSLCVRFPDGRRKQRKFLKTEPVQLLWSFCYAQMEESERKKAFKLVQAIPGASKTLDYEAHETFEQSGLASSVILVTWE